ncbi:MAG: tetratricopeptide repeat protein [Bacteroidia bacterium]
MRIIIKYGLFLFFLGGFIFKTHAQQYKPANALLIKQADSLLAIYELLNDSTSRDEALDIYLNLVKAEKATDLPDTQAIIHSQFQIGYIDMKWGEYKWGMEAFERMFKYVKRPRDQDIINEAIPYLAYCYRETRLENFTFDLPVFDYTERREFYFTISNVFTYTKDTIKVKINFGTYDGIGLGTLGTVRGVKTDLVKGHNNLFLGYCQVTDIAESQAILKIFDFQGTDSLHLIFKNDMVKLPIQFPKRYHDLVTKSLMYNTGYYNIEGYDFYDYRQWYMHGSDSLFEDIVLAMEHDIHNAYKKYEKSDIEVLKNVATSGRFAGKNLLEALKLTSKKDIKDFLHYTSFYAASYYGRISLIVKYADWVLDNCPVSYGEFFDAVDKAKSDEELKLIAQLYKKEAVENDFFTYLGNETESLVDNLQYKRAFEINLKQRKVASYMNLTEQIGWSYFFKARMHDSKNEHDSVITAYSNGLIYFKKSKDIKGEGFCIGNLAAKYYDLDNYKKALEFYRKSYVLKSKINTTDSSEYYKSIAIALHGMADSYYALSKFDSSLQCYTKATLLYNKSNTVDARARSLSAYKYIAKILKKQGKYLDAFKAYEALALRYNLLGNQKKVAETWDDLADVLFSLNDYEKSASYYTTAFRMKLGWLDYSGAGFSMASVGQALYNLGEFDKAIAAHDSAIIYRGLGDDQAGVAYSLNQIGSLYRENGDYLKAASYFDRAYEIYKKLDYKSSLANIEYKRGNLELKLLNYGKALQFFKQSLILYSELNDKIEVANSYYYIGSVYAAQNKYTPALNYFDTALAIQKETGDQGGQMYTLKYIGSLTEYQLKNNAKAMDIYLQALQIAKATGSPYNIAICLSSIGSLYFSMGLFSKSKPYLDTCHQIYIDIKDKLQQAYSLVNIGYYYTNMGDFKEGEKKFYESLKIAQEIKNNGAIAGAYSALGSIGRVTGEFDKSIGFLNQSIDLYIKTDNPWGVASSNTEMGSLYNMQSKYTVAVKYYLKADSIYHAINSEFNRSTPLNNAGTIFYHQGNWDSSLTYFYPALELLKKYEPDGDFMNLITINIGEVYVEKKEYSEGEKWLKLGLENSMKREEKRNKGIALRIMAKYEIKRQKYAEAKIHAIEAYKYIGDSGEIENTTDIYNQIGRVNYELGDYKTSIEWFAKTIKKSEAVGFKKFLYEAYYYSALGYNKLGQKDSALRQLTRSIAILEEISSQITGGVTAQKMFASGDLQQKMFETMVEWLLANGKVEEALIYLEKGNNEALNSKFKQLRSEETGATGETLKENEEKQAGLNKLDSEIIKEKSKPADQQKPELIKKLEEMREVSQKEYKTYFENLLKTNPKIQLYLSNSVNPDHFRAEKKNIAKDMAVLLYMMAEKNLYIFCATKDSVFAKVVSIESKELSKKIMTMYGLVNNPGFLPTTRRGSKTINSPKIADPEKVLNETSQELYNLLIGSVKKEIGTKTRLAIIPNGDLYYLPFHALIAKNENKKITYLMDEFKVQYSNMLKFIGSSQTVDLKDFRILAIGNSDKSLPGAELEVNNIKTTFPSANILIGDRATKAELYNQSPNYNVLHFATHGILDYNHFDSSYLVLAPDKKNNDKGHLTLNDIANLPNIEGYTLVILSACETNVKNDLIEGYPQTTASAFLAAGVETLLGSLWQVDDKSTELLMTKFFENLITNPNKRDALQDAQIAVSRMPGFNHPYYWAPIVYLGE